MKRIAVILEECSGLHRVHSLSDQCIGPGFQSRNAAILWLHDCSSYTHYISRAGVEVPFIRSIGSGSWPI